MRLQIDLYEYLYFDHPKSTKRGIEEDRKKKNCIIQSIYTQTGLTRTHVHRIDENVYRHSI